MKTNKNTAPLVSAVALGVGNAGKVYGGAVKNLADKVINTANAKPFSTNKPPRAVRNAPSVKDALVLKNMADRIKRQDSTSLARKVNKGPFGKPINTKPMLTPIKKDTLGPLIGSRNQFLGRNL
jgi:hypothetical protein